MKKRQQKIQIILTFIGLLLILITYFYYPYMNKAKFEENRSVKKDLKEHASGDESAKFESVEYNGLYDLDKSFVVKSDEAYILNEEPNIVYMNKMKVILYLNDGRVVNIKSDEGRYNKVTYDCYFEKNVYASDGETEIISTNLDLLATENMVKIYNNVNLIYPNGSLKADKIDYDFETKYFKVSMFDNKAIKMKVIK